MSNLGESYQVVEFIRGDEQLLNPIMGSVNDLDQVGQVVQPDQARTILCGGHPLAVVGLWPYWQGVATIWAFLDQQAGRANLKSFMRTFSAALEELRFAHNCHRLQADIREDFEAGRRFVKFFGFEYEGLMRAYGPDRADYRRYALTFSHSEVL